MMTTAMPASTSAPCYQRSAKYLEIQAINNFDQRIQFMRGVDLEKEIDPWFFVRCFLDVKEAEDPMKAADIVAKAFKAGGGLEMNCRINSSYNHLPAATFMDEFNDEEEHGCEDAVAIWLLKRAFRANGFKFMSECV